MTPASVTTPREKSTTIRGVVGRIVVLSLTLVSAIYLVPLLITYRMWLWLGVVLLATAAMFLLYSTKRFVPAKYLFPGTFFLTPRPTRFCGEVMERRWRRLTLPPSPSRTGW